MLAQSLLIVARMDVSLYSAAAAMNATERWQDLVADNLSSASVPGARQQEISFSAVQAGIGLRRARFGRRQFCHPLRRGQRPIFPRANSRPPATNWTLRWKGRAFLPCKCRTVPPATRATANFN